MDIRKFFGGKPSGASKSALTEVRASKGSPTAMRSPSRKKRPESISKRKALTVELSSDADSDGENPIPASLRKNLGKTKKTHTKKLSSSDDDLPPSASQARPRKRGAKILSGGKGPETTAIQSSSRHMQIERHCEAESSGSEEGSFVPAPPVKKGKRATTPPGQSKLSFSHSAARSSEPPKEREKTAKGGRQMSKIDAAEFFNKFGKTEEEIKREKKEKRHAEKGDVSESHASTDFIDSKTKKKKTDSDSIRVAEKEHEKSENADNSQGRRPHRKLVKPDSVETVSEKRQRHTPTEVDSGESALRKEKHHKERHKHDREESKKRTESGDEEAVMESSASKVSALDKREHRHGDSIHKDARKAHKDEEDSGATIKGTPTKESTTASSKSAKRTPEKALTTRNEIIEKTMSGTSSKSPEKTVTPAHISPPTLPWVDKYKPTSLKQLVGQNGDKSPMNKLLGWLRDWPKYHLGDAAKQKRPRPPPWMAQSDGTSFKAILLSGPPGIGKTTCALMACKELGLQFVEMNASDARNKKFLESKVAELIGCHQIDEYFGGKSRKVAKADELGHVLIMDEVDGMSGNEDRAGLSELIQMIRETRIPIICICNDRQSPKMRSLVNYCFDVRFQRPRVEQIRSRMQTIAFQEKLKLSKEQIDEVIEASNHDVRQTIYNLQLLSMGGKSGEIQQKDCAVNTFEAARRILSADTSMVEKQEMFFTDYTIIPLFIQENYPSIHSNKMNDSQKLNALRKAADSISQGDIVERTIRTTGSWGLLNEQALFSSILPSMYMNGYLKSMINFPSWLGKNSMTNKRQRLMRQLASHTHLKISADCHSLVTDYVPVLRDRLCRPLVEKEGDGVSEVIATYNQYDLVRDDAEAIAELAVWPGMKDPGSKIQPKVKAALTRALNKEHRLLPFAVEMISKARKKATNAADIEMEIDEEGNLVEVGDEDGLNDDSDDEVESLPSSQPTTTGKTSGSVRGGRGGRSDAASVNRGGARGRGRKVRGAKS
uniref:Activator 1 large subunit n=1 Tax=Ascaris suum TaxID=6253 RepID=F1KTG2_ASCSU